MRTFLAWNSKPTFQQNQPLTAADNLFFACCALVKAPIHERRLFLPTKERLPTKPTELGFVGRAVGLLSKGVWSRLRFSPHIANRWATTFFSGYLVANDEIVFSQNGEGIIYRVLRPQPCPVPLAHLACGKRLR